jgi:hypothetical protein
VLSWRSLKRRAVAWLVVELGWLLLKLLHALVRVEPVGREGLETARAAGRSVLIALWHGRILLPIMEHCGEGIVPMVSLSRDGEMIARTVEKLGYRTVRGSSSRGGREALRELVAVLSVPGTVGAIMPDGPKGPRHRLKAGVVQIARESRALVLPMSWGARRPIRFRSWDRFQLWRPFSRAVVLYGEPVECPPEGDLRAQCESLERALVELERRADAWYDAPGQKRGGDA